MSKNFRSFLFILAASLQILQFFTIADAQAMDLRLHVDQNSGSVRVEGRFLNAERKNRRNLTFLTEYAGTIGLADRVTDVGLIGGADSQGGLKRFNAGEYLADADITGWQYRVRLKPIGRPSAMAHVSWLNADTGILFLDDILPQTFDKDRSAMIRLDLPAGWVAVTPEPLVATNIFNVIDVETAVIVIAKDGNFRHAASSATSINISGSWQFSDAEAAATAGEILERYGRLFGSSQPKSQITIMRLPVGVPVGNWEADTRGRSVTILSSDMPFKNQSVQRLHEQLRHELFHLWFPNGVNLTGHYDWFYEGFALYQSLKLGVGMDRLRFTDFLDSLAQAYNLDAMQIDRFSLIAASKRRWSGANSTVYARGMLTAFLCDLAILQRSKGKSSVEDLIREIYDRAISSGQPLDGNDVVLAAMQARPELASIIERYVNGSGPIDWRDELNAAGIGIESENSGISLQVVSKPNGRQRDLLDKLGYNRWRNLSENSK